MLQKDALNLIFENKTQDEYSKRAETAFRGEYFAYGPKDNPKVMKRPFVCTFFGDGNGKVTAESALGMLMGSPDGEPVATTRERIVAEIKQILDIIISNRNSFKLDNNKVVALYKTCRSEIVDLLLYTESKDLLDKFPVFVAAVIEDLEKEWDFKTSAKLLYSESIEYIIVTLNDMLSKYYDKIVKKPDSPKPNPVTTSNTRNHRGTSNDFKGMSSESRFNSISKTVSDIVNLMIDNKSKVANKMRSAGLNEYALGFELTPKVFIKSMFNSYMSKILNNNKVHELMNSLEFMSQKEFFETLTHVYYELIKNDYEGAVDLIKFYKSSSSSGDGEALIQAVVNVLHHYRDELRVKREADNKSVAKEEVKESKICAPEEVVDPNYKLRVEFLSKVEYLLTEAIKEKNISIMDMLKTKLSGDEIEDKQLNNSLYVLFSNKIKNSEHYKGWLNTLYTQKGAEYIALSSSFIRGNGFDVNYKKDIQFHNFMSIVMMDLINISNNTAIFTKTIFNGIHRRDIEREKIEKALDEKKAEYGRLKAKIEKANEVKEVEKNIEAEQKKQKTIREIAEEKHAKMKEQNVQHPFADIDKKLKEIEVEEVEVKEQNKMLTLEEIRDKFVEFLTKNKGFNAKISLMKNEVVQRFDYESPVSEGRWSDKMSNNEYKNIFDKEGNVSIFGVIENVLVNKLNIFSITTNACKKLKEEFCKYVGVDTIEFEKL